ncbi:hypothetical protein [uncultured Desulfobulbus sp.]|uniref:hypothetical protein n=1 Tax=uncultured Desulfobulbus sp. TaxID=239745 RepID=UPI0029C7D8C8|nr:hypothetical protein [uncultured Desulfobulbus sp.]
MSNNTQGIAREFPQGTKLTAPTGGYVLWVQLAENVDGVELFHLAKAGKICIIPGAISTGTGSFKNCIRISCSTPWSDQMEDGMQRLGVLMSRLQAR